MRIPSEFMVRDSGFAKCCDRRYQSRFAALTAVTWQLLPKSKIWTTTQQFRMQNAELMRPSDVVRDSSISATPSVGMTAYTIIDDDEKVELL